MPLLQSHRPVLACLLGLILFAGCGPGTTTGTTTAPAGHDGKAHGPAAGPATPAAK